MIKKIILAASAAMFLLAGVSLARSDECQFGTFEDFKTSMAAQENITTVQLDDSQVRTIIEEKGAPPNGKEGVHYTAHLATTDELAAIFFFQEGCLINRIGPGPKFLILNMLGLRGANN